MIERPRPPLRTQFGRVGIVGIVGLVLLALVGLLSTVEPLGAQNANGPTIAKAAASQIGVTTIYDPAYVKLPFPNGDLPLERGVCADVVVRALRAIGLDLQAEVNKDLRANFSKYPQLWGLRGADKNIDHRRVPNLMRFFERKGKKLAADAKLQAGDIVAWRLPGGLYHIGIVAAEKVPRTERLYMIHNIGRGAQREDVLLSFEILGRYRW